MNISNNNISNNKNNGRVSILEPSTDIRFSMTDRIPVSQCSSFRDAMTGNWNDTPLSKAFFSSQNMRIIQNGIRAGVYNRSNGQYVIGEQNLKEIRAHLEEMKFSPNMYTSDVGFEFIDRFNEELEHFDANYGQIMQGLHTLSVGGIFVVKMFNMFELKTRQLISQVVRQG